MDLPDQSRERSTRKISQLVLILAVAGVVAVSGYQLLVLAREFIIPWTTRVSARIGSPAVDRSGYFIEEEMGQDAERFVGFIHFIKDNVPQDRYIVLPPVDHGGEFSNEGFVQYFVFPMSVVNCPRNQSHEYCVTEIYGADTYILAVPGFPPAEAASTGRIFIEYSGNWGLYVPDGSEAE